MDIDPPVPPSSAPKKLKFKPKPPPRRKTGLVLPKNEDDAVADPGLLRKINERHGTRRPKIEKKSSGNVTTSHGVGSSSSIPPKPEDESSKNIPNSKDPVQKSIISSSSIDKIDGDVDKMSEDDESGSLRKTNEDVDKMSEDDESGPSKKTKKKYKEPWNPHSNYPVSLPWRPLGSGDPEVLDEQEFGEEIEYDENKVNSASELGLFEENEEKKMILFTFPQKLPLGNQIKRGPVSAKGKEKVNSSSSGEEPLNNFAGFKELPNGHLGKMLVYKSGAIKFKLGDVMFDVSSGIHDTCERDVALMNTKSKDCCVVGPVDKQALIVPDLDSILDDINSQ